MVELVRTGLACAVLALGVAIGCAEDDLSSSLAKGACSPSGNCSTGFQCNAANECVPVSDAGTTDADATSDAPCANCPIGFICCNDVCVDKKNDPEHCGSCASVCLGTLCQSASCTNLCQPGLADCNKNVTDGCEAPASSCPSDAATD